MPDMLVKLYELPDASPLLEQLKHDGIVIRRAMAYDQRQLARWVLEHFNGFWARGCSEPFSKKPISCYIDIEQGKLLGFACYDATYRNFFGPTGVLESARGRGVGKALLLSCMHAMAAVGYGYAIIGGVGPADFYAKTVGAAEIPGSTPGIYRDLLEKDNSHS